MGTDHFPNRFAMVMEQIAEEYGIDISTMPPQQGDMERGSIVVP